MRSLLVYAAILNGAVALAQSPTPSLQNQQQTAGLVGVTAGQTAQLNVVYPTAPAPILQPLCSATLTIADNQGKVLKTGNIAQLTPGKSFSIDVNADTDLATPRTDLYGFSVAPAGCRLLATLEITDNATQKTVVIIQSRTTYPPPQSPSTTTGSAPAPGISPLPPGRL
jgi:hypothetical protein